jgi:ATP-binding cassette, subfamily B, bacterial
MHTMNASSIHLTLIDFTKPWWYIIKDQKWLAGFIIISVIIRDSFWALMPFLIAYILENGSFFIFGLVCSFWLLLEVTMLAQTPLGAKFQLQCIHSVLYSAHQYLLTVDPQYHVKRSSGIILAKIDRAARGYEEVLDQITYEFLPLSIGVLTMLLILSRYSLILVLVLCCCLAAMVGYGYYFARYACQKWENHFIKTDDDFRATAFENLAQVHLVRATFATDYMRTKLTNNILVNSKAEKDLWVSYGYTSRILGLVYSLSILLLVGFFTWRIKHNLTSLSFAIGLILAYIQSTKHLVKILQPFRRYMRGMAAITDLFNFIPEFGKQTIPVFSPQNQAIEKNAKTEITITNLVFGYGTIYLFDHHNLHLKTQENQHNKLYGIIGPSGVGKTTLLSILGGQLKPLQGTVSINGIDIYAVGDDTRRHIIALQGQIATSVKGTVRYNLLFGLPEDHHYCDAYLLDVLKQVGLEKALSEHQGLDTLLGEGALNISGGQRQRLNFAGLYLRALYYKPLLILIDEPTSSLDEISELAITNMIRQLAAVSLTLVIAHRLKTLEDAAGLIDLSLLTSSNKNIELYSVKELRTHSLYYRHLLADKDILR